MIRVNLALIEIENARRVAEFRRRQTLHPMAEYYADWVRERTLSDRSAKIDLSGGKL